MVTTIVGSQTHHVHEELYEFRGKSKTGKKKKRAATRAAPLLDSDHELDPTERLKRQKRAARFGDGQAAGAGVGRGHESFGWEDNSDAVQVCTY